MDWHSKRPLRRWIALGWIGLVIGFSLADARAARAQPSDHRSAPVFAVVYLKEIRSERNPRGRYRYEPASGTFRDLKTRRLLTLAEARNNVLFKDPQNVILTGRNLKPGSAHAKRDPQGKGSILTVELNRAGSARFSRFTHAHLNGLMALVLNGKVQFRHRIDGTIASHQMVIVLRGARPSDAAALAHRINQSI